MKVDRDETELPGQLNYWTTSWRPYLIIVIAGLLVFGRTVFFGYTYFDDDIFILKHFNSIAKPSAIPAAFQNLYFGSYYRPIFIVFVYAEMKLVELYLREGKRDQAEYYQDRLRRAGYQLQSTRLKDNADHK